MQESSRYNTIYDLASLRLHPDGSRVHQTSANGNGNLRLGKPGNKRVVYGPRRGWFARDAAGSMMSSVIGPKSNLKRRRAEDAGKDSSDDEASRGAEEGEIVGVEEGEIVEDGRDEVGPGGGGEGEVKRGRTMKRKNSREMKSKRAKKRLRFNEDDTFIGDLTEERGARFDEDKGVAPPSSDLLKAIHHHSAQFYKARGTLSAPTKHQLEIVKKEVLKKEQEVEEALSFKKTYSHINGSRFTTPTLETPNIGFVKEKRRNGYDRSSNRERMNRTLSPASSPAVVTPTTTLTPGSGSGAVKNMYRVFEGSFLLGLGVLAQEKTAQLLESKVPQEVTDDPGTSGILGDKGTIYPAPYLGGYYETSPFYDSSAGADIFATTEEGRWKIEQTKLKTSDRDATTTDFDDLYNRLSFGCDSADDGYGFQSKLTGDFGKGARKEIGNDGEFSMEDHVLSGETEDIGCIISDEEIDELDADQY